MHILKLTIFSLQYNCIISFILKITGIKTTKFCIHKSKVVCEGLSHQTSQNGYKGVPQHSIAENVSQRFLIKSSLKQIKHQIQIKIINIINVETFFVLLKSQKIIQIIFFKKGDNFPCSTHLVVFIDHPGLKSTVQDGGSYSSQQSPQHQDVEVVEVLSNQNYNVVNLNMFIVTPHAIRNFGGYEI